MAGIDDKIKALCEMVVLVEPTDLKPLADLYTNLEEIGDWAKENSRSHLAAAAESAANLVKTVIFEEASNPTASLEIVGQTLSALQAIICEGRSVDGVAFPAELGLGRLEQSEVPDSTGDESRSSKEPSGFVVSLPPHVDDKIFADFLSRQGEVLDQIETLVLALEKSDDPEKMGALRRILHTLKGEAAMLALTDVENLCHKTESVLENHHPRDIVDQLLGVKDWLGRIFEACSGKGPSPGPADEILDGLAASKKNEETADPTQAPTEPNAKESITAEGSPSPGNTETKDGANPFEADPGLLGDFVSEAREHLEAADLHMLTLETEPRNEEALNAVFRAFHTIKGVAGFLALDEIRTLAHEAEHLLDRARKGELALEGKAVDVTFEVIDALKRLVGNLCDSDATEGVPDRGGSVAQLVERIERVVSGKTEDEMNGFVGPDTGEARKLGEILVDSGALSQDRVNTALEKQNEAADRSKLGEQLVKDGEVSAKKVAQALRGQKAQSQGTNSVRVKEAVKVDSDRLDRLVDTIGELVIAESMVMKSIESMNGGSLQLAPQMSQLDKITRELQAMGTSLRMIPVRSTFQKMARLIRDLAKKANKPVEFVMSGEDTELDKSVVDRIGDPLVHMVRNAVDHGLETSPEERVKAGKPGKGRVELRAFHQGGSIHIEIEDDGRGLDRQAILAKAQERGLVNDGESLSDREVFTLVFEPGFSTAKKITDVSGRGVGMDVVKRNIEALRGHVEIRSESGVGTVFSIRLPLTLAIIDGMVARVGRERYIIPTLSIVKSIRPDQQDLSTVVGRGEVLMVQGSLVPLFRLDRLYDIDGAEQQLSRSLVLVIEDGGHQAGLVIDELLGQQQIVIKTLGEAMSGIPGVSGGAVMPDGRVGLILDPGGLVRLANGENGPVQRPSIRDQQNYGG
jgi:two-component system chemotaxis sensor kinase CheA